MPVYLTSPYVTLVVCYIYSFKCFADIDSICPPNQLSPNRPILLKVRKSRPREVKCPGMDHRAAK